MTFITVSRYVKIIKIHQDFPELWWQMHCHVFYESQRITPKNLSTGVIMQSSVKLAR